MKPKKNPKADLSRKWILFLQIGLILVLFLTLQAIQWESEVPKKDNTSFVITDEPIQEDVPVTVLPKDTPPPPPPAPQVIEIIENDEPQPEDDIPSTEVKPEDTFEPEDVVDARMEETPEKVPFEVVENVPVFPGCEGLKDNDERKSCMSSEISRFVNKEFDTGLGSELGLTGTNLVIVIFVVNQEGRVEQIQTRAPHPALAKEAERVIKKLPVMQPGLQRGKPVPVSYSIPIRFKVQD